MDVLQLSDGTVEIVGSEKDFSDLLYEKLGLDVKRWFDTLVSNYFDTLDDLKEDIAEMERDMTNDY